MLAPRGSDDLHDDRSPCRGASSLRLVGDDDDDDDSNETGYLDKLLVLEHEFDARNRFMAREELVVSMLHQGALDRLCEFCADQIR